MRVCAEMGLPGAVGSVDATHIRWHMCPVEKVYLATGKEKHPSVAFQVCYMILQFLFSHVDRSFRHEFRIWDFVNSTYGAENTFIFPELKNSGLEF